MTAQSDGSAFASGWSYFLGRVRREVINVLNQTLHSQVKRGREKNERTREIQVDGEEERM